jgi:hypothetical protein
MNIYRASGWALLGAGFSLSAASCDGNDVSTVGELNRPESTDTRPLDPGAATGASRCVPGQTSPCFGACSTFGAGYQLCADDGRSYGQCICPVPRPAVAGSGVVVVPPRELRGGGRVDGVPGPVANIGSVCESNTDCGGNLRCFDAGTNSLGVGGPAGGYCSLLCDDNRDCSSVDPAAGCGTLGGRSMCLRRCTAGDPAPGDDKCLDRSDLICFSRAAQGDAATEGEPQTGICVPNCQSDAGCSGRFCDIATGLCADAPRGGDPIGAACDDPAACSAGVCLGASDEARGECTAFCTVGAPGCGYDGSEALIGAACILPQVPGEGQGDRGLCLALCDDAADCTQPGFTCVLQPTSGRAGVCVPTQLAGEPEPPAEPDTPDPATPEAFLGTPCASDDDCSEGVCLSESGDDFGLGGGPAGGYCSLPCEVTEDCLEAGAVCATTPGGSYCLKGCAVEDPGVCGRDVSACVSLGPAAACLPVCAADADCQGRVCDGELGLCVDAASVPPPQCTTDADCDAGSCDVAEGQCVVSAAECTTDADCALGTCDVETGLCTASSVGCTDDAECGEQVCDAIEGTCIDAPIAPVGSACTADADCAGESASPDETRLCLVGDDVAFCSAVCALGTPLGCEAYGTDAFCLLPVDDTFGYCLQLCDAPDDCAQPGYECLDLGTVINGRSGACLPPEPAPPEAEPVPPEPAASPEPAPTEPAP